ncbi:MAG: ABC transporter substrate-binding protein [Phycisphaerae bacterium]
MKWFYPAALLAVTALVLSPYFLLLGETVEIDNVVTGWDEDGQPLIEDNPTVLYNSWGSDIKSLEPATAGDTTSAGFQGHLFEGLYTYHFLKRPVSEDTIVPQLAAGMPEVSEDHLTYTIKIRPNVKYHRNPCFGDKLPDGRWPTRTVTAHDFVYAIKRIADFHLSTGLSWSFLRNRIVGLDEYRKRTEQEFTKDQFERYDLPVEGVQALDDMTLQFKLKKPYPQFMLVLAMQSYAPVPREAVEHWLADKEPLLTEFRKKEQLVGTGPYTLHTYKPKDKIIFVRNPDFRHETYPTEGEPAHGDYPGDKARGLLDDAGKPVPFIDVIRWDWMNESFSTWMSFQAKRLDVAGIPAETFDSVLTPDKELEDKWRKKGIYLTTYTNPTIYWLSFNMTDEILGQSKALRQAIALAFDIESYIKVIHKGRAKRAVNIVPSSFPSHEAAGAGPYFQPHTDETHDELLAKAKEKLAEAKKQLGEKGLLIDGEIPKLRLEMGNGEYFVKVGEFCQQQFRKIGLELEPVYNTWPVLQTKVHSGKAQMHLMGWHADYPDAENFLQLFYGPNIEAGTNSSRYSDQQYDTWFEKSRTMFRGPERMDLYVKMIRKLSEDVPLLPMTEPISYIMVYDWMHNIKPHPIGYGYTRYRRIDSKLRADMGGRKD